MTTQANKAKVLARDYASACSTEVLNTMVGTMTPHDRAAAMVAFGTPLELEQSLPGQAFAELFRRHLCELSWQHILRKRREKETGLRDDRPATAQRQNGRRAKR